MLRFKKIKMVSSNSGLLFAYMLCRPFTNLKFISSSLPISHAGQMPEHAGQKTLVGVGELREVYIKATPATSNQTLTITFFEILLATMQPGVSPYLNYLTHSSFLHSFSALFFFGPPNCFFFQRRPFILYIIVLSKALSWWK